MKNEIDLYIDIGLGTKNFTSYTMDFSKKYIDINVIIVHRILKKIK